LCSVTDGVPDHETGARARAAPAAAGLVTGTGVVAAPVDGHPGVARVGVDRHVLARPGCAVALECRRVEWRGEQPGRVEHVGDRARAVVAGRLERAMPAAVDVRRAGDPVGRRDHRRNAAGVTAAATTAGGRRAVVMRAWMTLVEHLAGADPELLARGGTNHAVRLQAVGLLVALDRARGPRAEDAVGAEAKGALEGLDPAVPDGAVGGRRRAAGGHGLHPV